MPEPTVLHLEVVGMPAGIACADAGIADLLRRNYSGCLRSVAIPVEACPHYSVTRADDAFALQRHTGEPQSWEGVDAAELIFLLEKDLIIEAQIRRPDLYFLHAAAVMIRGRAVLLIGSSGSGKSTACWGLLHHGCAYLSDELAPVDLQHLTVAPYPHALCLKSIPDEPYALPADTLRTDATLHVPVDALPCSVASGPTPLHAVVHVRYVGTDHRPSVERIGAAEAGMLIYANALNPLSHVSDGLDAAIRIAKDCAVYRMTTGSLSASATLLLSVVGSEIPA